MRSIIRQVILADRRRLLAALFMAATFGMMLILSLPVARFLPIRPPEGMLRLPVLLDPLRPFVPGAPGLAPAEAPAGHAAAAPSAPVPRLRQEVGTFPRPVVPGPEQEAPNPSSPPGCPTRTTDRPRTAPRCGWEPRADPKFSRHGPEGFRRPGSGGERHARARDESKGRWTGPKHGSKHWSKQDHGKGHGGGHESHHKPKKR